MVVSINLGHSFRDRLRAVDIDAEFVDQLFGCAVSTGGQSYRSALTLEQKHTH